LENLVPEDNFYRHVEAALDLVRWVRFRWHLKPRIAVGDAKYGTIANIVGLEQMAFGHFYLDQIAASTSSIPLNASNMIRSVIATPVPQTRS
jgi:hypothetical protein